MPLPAKSVFPQVNYGQGPVAWNPATQGPVYQAMERARAEPHFAKLFAADILFGQERSGNHYWSYEQVEVTREDENGQPYTAWETQLVMVGCDWLYNENTLNASKSWVAALFGPAAALVEGTWAAVGVLCMGWDWGFIPEYALAGDVLRMVTEGNYAFSAVGCNGVEVRVPYAENSKPLKQGRGRIECGNSKKTPRGRYYR